MKKVVCHNMDKENIEVDASELSWRPSVYGILIKDNKILLSKQWDGYDFPGGGMHIHENIEEALTREFWEETGIKVKVGKIAHCESEFFIPKFHQEKWNCILVYFFCEYVSGELSKDNGDEFEKEYMEMPEWVDLNDIDKIKFYNGVDSPQVIRKAMERFKN